MVNAGAELISFIHSHPTEDVDIITPSEGDRDMIDIVKSQQPNAKPTFKLYSPTSNKYKPYKYDTGIDLGIIEIKGN